MLDICAYISPRRMAHWMRAAARLAAADLTHGWLKLLQLARSTLAGGIPFVIQLRQTGHRFKVVTAADIWAIDEIFMREEYAWDRVGAVREAIIIDIGANIGGFSVWAAHRYPNSMILAYEPFPGSYDLLLENLAVNGVTGVQPFPLAVWGRRGSIVMDTHKLFPSMYSTAEPASPHQPGLRVNATSLDAIFADHSLPRCDILKLDCEGAEYEILLNASAATLDRVGYILMEYHNAGSERHHCHLIACLEQRGFDIVTAPNPALKSTGYLFAAHSNVHGLYARVPATSVSELIPAA